LKLRKLARASMCCILALIAAAVLRAQTERPKQPEPNFFHDLRWRLIGPFRGGRTLGVTGVRGKRNDFYFGSVGGGVWKTNDAGRTWKPIFDSQDIASIGAVAVAPSSPNMIYVGSGEADMRSSISYGNGMYKSTDAGKSWTRIGLGDARQIGRVLIDPRDANLVYVAALGHPYGPNSERGVFRSKNGGKNWQKILFHDENTGAIDLAFEPGNPKVIYAALWQTRRPPWSIYPPANGPGSGLYRSADGGDHWEQVSGHGLPSEGLGRMGIAFAPSNAKRIYLIVDAKEPGLYRSDDGGQNWQRTTSDKRVSQRGWYFGEVTVDPKDAETLYLPNTATYKSRDGGKTFEVFKGAPGGDDYHELWIDPDDSLRMALSSDQGTIITLNGGETWSSWYNQPTGQFYHVATDNRFPYWVFGAQQDSGTAATPSRGKYRSLNFHDWRPLEAGDENGYVAPDPLNPGVVFGGTLTRQDLNTEQVLQMPPNLVHQAASRRTWTLPLVFSPTVPNVLYSGSELLYRTSDGGNSWQVISPDLSREEPGALSNLDASTAADAPASKRRGVIYTIGPAFVKSTQIWVGTDDGLVHLTQDDGKTWENVTPPELTPWSKVTHIEASHSDAGTAYVAVDRHRLDDYRPYLYRTRDFGKSWKLVADGIPEGSFLNCVREDPARAGLLYACTEKGVYVSFDDGDHWQPLQLNLPVTSVRDLVAHENDLVVATFGRSFWILDDLTPLRQLDAHLFDSEAWLFRPAAAIRVHPGYDEGTPVPMDEPLASNPPSGAVIDYYLKSKPATPIQLEILDSEGKVARQFASNDAPQKLKPEELPFTSNWVPDPPVLQAEPGTHRLVWDIRYALPKDVHTSSRRLGGWWAPPGNYTVKLTVNGKSYSQPLVVKADPRLKTTREEFVRQFDLSSSLVAKLGKIEVAISQAEALKSQVEGRKQSAKDDAELRQALEGFAKHLDSLSGRDGRGEDWSFGLSAPSSGDEPLSKLSSALGSLLSLVESGDSAPTSDAARARVLWEEAGENTLSRFAALQTEELEKLNSLLSSKKLKPLTMESDHK